MSEAHREWECPVNGCPVCMPPLGVVITMDEKAEFTRLRAENTRLRDALRDVINHWVLSDAPERVVINRAVEVLDDCDDTPICDGEFAGPNACTCGDPKRHM
jgi:hypothetical protein